MHDQKVQADARLKKMEENLETEKAARVEAEKKMNQYSI